MRINAKILVFLLIGALCWACSDDDDGEENTGVSIRYSIEGIGRANIVYTGSDGIEVDLSNQALPWSASITPFFEEGNFLFLFASCEDCEIDMDASIYIQGQEVATDQGSTIQISVPYERP